MKRSDYNRLLRNMEHVRELGMEAETERERLRLFREYGQMAKAIEPYVTGKLKLTEEKPHETAHDAISPGEVDGAAPGLDISACAPAQAHAQSGIEG